MIMGVSFTLPLVFFVTFYAVILVQYLQLDHFVKVQDSANAESDREVKKSLQGVISDFKTALKGYSYYGSYFARSAKCCDRFCDETGWFLCEGSHDEDSCTRDHTINPYASRDARVIFSTWNLDHQ